MLPLLWVLYGILTSLQPPGQEQYLLLVFHIWLGAEPLGDSQQFGMGVESPGPLGFKCSCKISGQTLGMIFQENCKFWGKVTKEWLWNR